jgi:hypothetical protein
MRSSRVSLLERRNASPHSFVERGFQLLDRVVNF